jgi:hypothetical protein
VSITGGGLPKFNTAVDGVSAIRSMFADHFSKNLLEESAPTYDSYPVIDASNRYFSSRKDVPLDGVVEIPKLIDPQGILASLENNNLVYALDNVVEYYKVADGRQVPLQHSVFHLFIIHCFSSMAVFDPALFRVGDIVEAQISFLAASVGEKYRMKSILRSLALLDSIHSEVMSLLILPIIVTYANVMLIRMHALQQQSTVSLMSNTRQLQN